MSDDRRARPTLRCLVDDLGIATPPLDVDLGEIDHPFLDELRRVAPTSPEGQKRILSIEKPLVYRIRVSSERGATWIDDRDGVSVVWLCGAHRREADSDDDAFVYFAELHDSGRLLPSDDDRVRDLAETAIRVQRRLTKDLLSLVDKARSREGVEVQGELDDWLPCRVLVIAVDETEEVWCALSVRGNDGAFAPDRVRDLLFASLEQHLAPVLFEARDDWPTGLPEWFEAVVLGIR
jgi:hypothetical protein